MVIILFHPKISDSYHVYYFFRRMFSPISEFTAQQNSHALGKKKELHNFGAIGSVRKCVYRVLYSRAKLTQHIAFQNASNWKIDKNIAVSQNCVFRVGNEDRLFLFVE